MNRLRSAKSCLSDTYMSESVSDNVSPEMFQVHMVIIAFIYNHGNSTIGPPKLPRLDSYQVDKI